MGDKYNLKSLSKMKAKKDVEIEAEDPKVKQNMVARGPAGEKMYAVGDYKRMDKPSASDEFPKAKVYEDDLDDHQSRNKKVKQMRKFHMLRSLLGDMDAMDSDGDGIPDSKE